MRAKEHGQEMGYDEVPRNISTDEMRRKALRFMEKDVIREIISEHMAGLDEAVEGNELAEGGGGMPPPREKKGKGLRGFGKGMPLTQIQISQAQGLSAANLVVSQSKVNRNRTIPAFFLESEELPENPYLRFTEHPPVTRKVPQLWTTPLSRQLQGDPVKFPP